MTRVILRGVPQVRRTSPTTPPSECDPAGAIGRLAGYVDVYGSLVSSLMTDQTGSLAQLRSAVDRLDCDATVEAAHSIKGLALTCGASRVASAAADLEKMGRSREMNQATSALTALLEALVVACRELAPYWQESGGGTAR